MKKYLLFAQGNFKDYATIAYIVDAISDVTHSDFLKYRVGDGYSIAIHFGSNEEFVKLKDFIDIVMTKCSKAHYIVEYNDNMSVSMDENDLGTFLLEGIKSLTEQELTFLNSFSK